MQHRRELDKAKLLGAAQLQIDDADYFAKFHRSTDDDSAPQEFTAAMIRDVARRPDPVASHRDYAKIALAALNTGAISERKMSLITLGFEVTPSEALLPVPKHLLAHYRRVLLAAADNPMSLSPVTCAQLRGLLAGRIIGVPVTEIGANGVNTVFRIVAANFETAFDYAALLLISDFSFELRHCKRPTCPNLFLRERGVKNTQRDHCSDECRLTFLRDDGKHRVNASRAGVSIDQWRDILSRKGDTYKPARYLAEQKGNARVKK